MFLLLKISPDGDSFELFTKKSDSIYAFSEACNLDFFERIYLVKPDSVGEEFGFSRDGEMYGCEVISSWEKD